MHTEVFRLDDMVVDVAGREMTRAGARIALEPKSFDVLVILLREAGRVVGKKELLAAVWSDVHVTDSSLARAVTQVRRALNDDPKAPRYIETVPTRGYRFIGPVQAASDDEQEASRPARQGMRGRSPGPRLSAGVLVAMLAGTVTLGVVGGWTWSRRSEAFDQAAVIPLGMAIAQAATQAAVQLTTSRGLDIDPAFSADGAMLAYASDESGALEIQVRPRLAEASARALTTNGGDNVSPAWSPDDLWVAYHSRRDGGVWVVPAAGGTARQLVPDGSAPAWSPDGRSIVFQSAGEADVLGGPGGSRSTLSIVDVASGRTRPLTSHGSPPGAHGHPVWLPSGQHIVFVVTRVPAAEIWSISLVGDAVRIASCAAGCRPFVFVRNGQTFLSYVNPSRRPELWVVPVDERGGLEMSAARPAPLPTTVDLKDVTVSPDGRRMAYSLAARTSELWQVMLPGGDPTRAGGPAPLLDERRPRYGDPLFSPDGSVLGYTTVRGGDRGEVWLYDVTSQASRRLGARGSFVKGWSRDGRAVLVAAAIGGSADVVRVDLATNRAQSFLVFPGWSTAPDLAQRMFTLRLSPDLTRYFYTAEDEAGLSLWTGQVGQPGNDTRLALTGDGASFGAWSTDGSKVAYQAARGWRTALAIQQATASASPRVLVDDVDHAWVNDWSPDDRWLLMATMQRGRWTIDAVDAASGRRQALTLPGTAAGYVRWPTWSPAGDRVVYEQGVLTGNIWVAELPE